MFSLASVKMSAPKTGLKYVFSVTDSSSLPLIIFGRVEDVNNLITLLIRKGNKNNSNTNNLNYKMFLNFLFLFPQCKIILKKEFFLKKIVNKQPFVPNSFGTQNFLTYFQSKTIPKSKNIRSMKLLVSFKSKTLVFTICNKATLFLNVFSKNHELGNFVLKIEQSKLEITVGLTLSLFKKIEILRFPVAFMTSIIGRTPFHLIVRLKANATTPTSFQNTFFYF